MSEENRIRFIFGGTVCDTQGNVIQTYNGPAQYASEHKDVNKPMPPGHNVRIGGMTCGPLGPGFDKVDLKQYQTEPNSRLNTPRGA